MLLNLRKTDLMEANKNEIMYLLIFSVLKRLYAKGSISKEIFERLNTKNAEQQGCKVITI